ncbi:MULTISPECIES: ATP-binding protein [Burkholderia]|uniref:ATP-binding protein n=1 Tax=Burkholderia TaxID=32008 RepID=UPI000876D8EB|nr:MULTISPECIES: ATP-binding protein [Burkholderia]TCT27690.1 AAA ATPase-like protein [Burkholderia vietnamiensis]CAG9218817.1 AAA ATPase domain-containing protein [Burkholderia vietnamiensis]SCZ42413.1 AAA ATPase domain-containing protein [Burkholderia vietnamiensis]SFY31210.1 AAA ATPase domain-containing protein [Burkholderia vietnamiensis]
MVLESDLKGIIDAAMRRAGVTPFSIQIRTFPGEIIAIVEVERNYQRAIEVAQELDSQIENGFVTVRQVKSGGSKKEYKAVTGVHDPRVGDLLSLLSTRSRTSESQPSLRYIQDVEERLSVAITPRHHLIFGRRGVGKTSMLLEARRILENEGAYVLWVNVQSLRSLSVGHAFLTVALKLCDLLLTSQEALRSSQTGLDALRALRANIELRFMANGSTLEDVAILVPLLQQECSRFTLQAQRTIYLFVDDIHYLPSAEVPHFLDLLHGVTRDNLVWLKIAGIQHQTRWFIPVPPTGLQTGHDAAIINLDVTLEHPERAKQFLESVLRGYIEECNASPLSNVLSTAALDRLVLASGGVPRDFLTLCAASIQTARQRPNAKTVGVQDVNNAAGVAGQTKLQELEDDAAATSGRSGELVASLNIVRDFLLTTEEITFFRVDFRDKELRSVEYRTLQALADLRMLHLINPSLSDQHHAGQRAEVYLLDLSQYSGSRLKQGIHVLDFERGHMVLKRTRSSEPARIGDTVLKLVSLLRRAPTFELSSLKSEVALSPDV